MTSRRQWKDRVRKAQRRADGLQLMLQNREAKIERLRAHLAKLEVEVARLRESNAMACENPCGCCCGCNYADVVHGYGPHPTDPEEDFKP